MTLVSIVLFELFFVRIIIKAALEGLISLGGNLTKMIRGFIKSTLVLDSPILCQFDIIYQLMN